MMLFEEDRVCNRLINVRTAAWKSRYHGQQFVFCSLECHERFELEPEDYDPMADAAARSSFALFAIAS